MDYLLTIVKENPFNYGKDVNKGKLLFVFTNIDNDDTEILYKTYYPSIDSSMLDNLRPLHEDEKKVQVEKKQFDFENVLKRTVDEFINFAKEGGHRLFINFENNGMELTTFFKNNYQRHVLKNRNTFNQEIVGTTFTARVDRYFNSHSMLNTIKTGLTIKDFTIEKSKELL